MDATDLGGCFTGTLARFAGTIRTDDGGPGLAADRLLDPVTVRDLVDRYAASLPGADPRAVVSMWSQWHCAAVITPTVVACVVARQPLPVALADCRLALHDNGCTAAVLVPAAAPGTTAADRKSQARPGSPPAGTDRRSGLGDLLDGHLTPLIAFVAREFAVSPKLLWTNAAASFAWTLQQCAALPEADGAALAEAEGRLTLAEAWPTARNPFAGALRPSPFVPLDQCSRRVCCLRYLLPGWADCGSFCPLPTRDRATGTADGPAAET
jgi:ferric iron reductase protein FhuF